MLEIERAYLSLKPPKYDCARIMEPRVNKYSCISIDSCYYSVPDSLVGEFVLTKVYPDKIICHYKQEKVAEHKKRYGNHEWAIDINHFIKTLKQKPGALAGSTAFSQIEPRLRHIYDKYFLGREKGFIELIELAGKIGIKKIEDAIAELEKINPASVTLDKITVICSRKSIPIESIKDRDSSEIEKTSKDMLVLYSKMLSDSSVNLSEVNA